MQISFSKIIKDRCVGACVRACVHACVRACVGACVRACVRASMCPVEIDILLHVFTAKPRSQLVVVVVPVVGIRVGVPPSLLLSTQAIKKDECRCGDGLDDEWRLTSTMQDLWLCSS